MAFHYRSNRRHKCFNGCKNESKCFNFDSQDDLGEKKRVCFYSED